MMKPAYGLALALAVCAFAGPAAARGAFEPTYHPKPCSGDSCRADDPRSGETCQGLLCSFSSAKAMQTPVTAAQAAEAERARAAAQAAAAPPAPVAPAPASSKTRKRVAKAKVPARAPIAATAAAESAAVADTPVAR